MSNLIRHPSSKLTPELLINLLKEVKLENLFVVAVNDDGDFEVHYTSDLSVEDLCVIAMLTQSASLEAINGQDDEDEE